MAYSLGDFFLPNKGNFGRNVPPSWNTMEDFLGLRILRLDDFTVIKTSPGNVDVTGSYSKLEICISGVCVKIVVKHFGQIGNTKSWCAAE